MEAMDYLKFHHSIHNFFAGAAAYQPVPNFGDITIANGALLKLVQVQSTRTSQFASMRYVYSN